MTIAKNPLDPKKLEIAKTHFAAACNLQAVTHAKIKNRPKDKVQLCEPKANYFRDQKKSKKGYSRLYVKMSYDKLPSEMQEEYLNTLEPYK